MLKRSGLLFLLVLSSLLAQAQYRDGQSHVRDVYFSIDSIPFAAYTEIEKPLTLLSEVHYVSCNYPVKEAMLRSLVKRKKPIHVLLEYSFSYSVLCNEYLVTGSDTMLQLITSSCEEMEFFKNIFLLNRELPEDAKIQFWGIDFELQGNRLRRFLPAIQALDKRFGFDSSLQSQIALLGKSNNRDRINEIRSAMSVMLNNRKAEKNYGEKLLALLVTRNTDFQKNRDREMFSNIIQLYSFLKDHSPGAVYFGQLGIAHVNPGNTASLFVLLQNDPHSPFKQNVSAIGTQYINCTTNYRLEKQTHLKSEGMVSKEMLTKAAGQYQDNKKPYIVIVKKETADRKGSAQFDLSLLLYNYNGERAKHNCY